MNTNASVTETTLRRRMAVYTRTAATDDRGALASQRRAAESYIAERKGDGWICLPERYDDDGVSGFRSDRPALRRLLADVEAGRVDGVVVHSLDRLSRSTADTVRLIDALKARGVTVTCVAPSVNLATSVGRALLGTLKNAARWLNEPETSPLAKETA